MDNLEQGVVNVHALKVPNSVPNMPITKMKDHKQYLQNTPIPRVTSPKWKEGTPTPIQEGVISPNQQAINLLTGFANGHIKMAGDKIEHLTTVLERKSIEDSLQELSWDSSSPVKKKKVDGSANRSERHIIAQKELC